MEINISFDEPMIPENLIMSLTEDDISSFYVAASDDSDKFNLYFVLLTTYFQQLEKQNLIHAAHLCYLMSYYIFMMLVPPGSEDIALYYAKQAYRLHPCEKYLSWVPYVEEGN